jgi:hypothetical protein
MFREVEDRAAVISQALLKLKFPSSAELEPWITRLVDHPGSMIVLAIENPREPNGPKVSWAWLSSEEREAIRKSLLKINTRRNKNGDPPTNQSPHAAQKR